MKFLTKLFKRESAFLRIRRRFKIVENESDHISRKIILVDLESKTITYCVNIVDAVDKIADEIGFGTYYERVTKRYERSSRHLFHHYSKQIK